jgi:hypothetical protein
MDDADSSPDVPLAPLVADLYRQASPPLRLRLLNTLLRHLGPLALVTVAAGAFATLLPDDRWTDEVEATQEDTRRLLPGQVQALADYVGQKSPEALSQAVAMAEVGAPR